MNKINIEEAFKNIHDYWKPHIAGELNGQHVKLVRVKGDFIWHHHDDADELFLVLKGRLIMRFRDREIELNQGEFCVVPRGVEHMPVAPDEVHLLLFEPAGTLNTGNVLNSMTVQELPKLGEDGAAAE